MRQMWELPRPSLTNRLGRLLAALSLVWAAAAVPLTVWLSVRTPPQPPAPATRELSVMERAAVRSAAQELANSPVALTFTAVSATAHLQVEQVADVARNVSYGKVISGSQHGDLITIGDRVMLRGNSDFWATVGVPTADPGWIEVGDRLGVIPFPLTHAVSLLDPTPQSTVDTSVSDSETMAFRNADLVAQFTTAAISQLDFGPRSAKLAHAPADAAQRLSTAATTPAVTSKLVGSATSLAVSSTPAPPAGPGPAPADAPAN